MREELRLLAALAPGWRLRRMPWSPRSGAQLEFGRHLRLTAGVEGPKAEAGGLKPEGRRPPADNPDPELRTPDRELSRWPGEEDPAALRFRTQTTDLTDDNLRWTARARFGTYKFFGFVATDPEGYAALTPAGRRFVESTRPGEVLLRQLLKWQYPDNQHRGSRWPAQDFAIFPFIATARLIADLGGLTRREIALYCFTMRRTEDAAATAEVIRQHRQRQVHAFGRAGKARDARRTLDVAQARYEAEGRRVVLGSTDDYADALVRYFRYTGLFSVRGARIVVAGGRERELEELIYPAAQSAAGVGPPATHDGSPVQPRARPAHHAGRSETPPATHDGSPVQLALGQAPPVRLAAPVPLFAGYADATAFYAYYGDSEQPNLPWESVERLRDLARRLDEEVAALRAREIKQRTGRTVLAGPALGETLPGEYEPLVALVDGLRRRKVRLESALYALESRTPRRLSEALDFYQAILAREVIDPPTFLEWNTWRVFLALDQAREIVPHLALDDDLQPLSTAQGNQPDLEVDYGAFGVVVEVTLRTGADQRQAEARPVTRHVLEAQRRAAGGRGGPVYGLFLAPKIHADTATDFFVALKYRVIERQRIAVVPLTLRQFVAALRPFGGHVAFAPAHLHDLLERCTAAATGAETGDDWIAGIDSALRHWLAGVGGPAPVVERPAAPLPLPLFGPGW